MKFWLYILLGVALLGLGSWRQFVGVTASPADQARCEQIVAIDYADDPEALAIMQAKCDEPGIVAMMDARHAGTDIQDVAESIASANRYELIATLINMALIGAGIGVIAVAARIAIRQRNLRACKRRR